MRLFNERKIKGLVLAGIFLFAGSVSADEIIADQKFETKKTYLGKQETIFIDPVYDFKSRGQTNITLRKIGVYGNYYIEDEYWNGLSTEKQTIVLNQLSNVSSEFDQRIYPRLHNVFGSEWTPGIDGDPKINIVFTQIIQQAGGYFNPNDEYLKSQIVDGRSNEKEIIYLNVFHLGNSRLKSFLAHEFQHMINWYQKTKAYGSEEEVWLNEALSEYASTVAGFDTKYEDSNLESRVDIFLKKPSDSLTEWNNSSDDYGAVNLFMQYFADHYGANVIGYILTEPQTGIQAINAALKKAGYSETFADIYNNWTIANLLNNSYTANNYSYSYKNPNLSYINFHVTPTVTYEFKSSNSKVNANFNTKNWSSRWYAFTSSKEMMNAGGVNNLKIDFSSSSLSAKFAVPYVTYFSTGQASVGYMNIGDNQKSNIIVNGFGKEVVSVVIMPINEYQNSNFNSNDREVSFSLNASILTSEDPMINIVTPQRGTVNGNVLLTIKGENFNKDSKIYFDKKEMVSPKIIDANTIEIIAPPHSQGQVDIKVTNLDSKTYTLPNAFTYFAFAKDTLIRAANDYKVYIVDDKYKRWIQSAEIFNFYKNFSWNKIVVVSAEERDAYQTAALVRADNDYKVYEINGDNTKHWLNITPEEFNVSGRKWDMVQIINEKERDFYETGPDVR